MTEPSIKGYSAEQVATGSLEDGHEVVILYVKEFREQLDRVRNSGNVGYFYTWSYAAETDSHVLFIYWENEEEIAVVFPPTQHQLVEGLRTPKNLIITGNPIDLLVDYARQAGQDSFDLSGPVVYLQDVVFKEENPCPN